MSSVAEEVDMSEKQCRICYLNVDGGDDEVVDEVMELGCDCKDDLAIVHKECALTWFMIKGDFDIHPRYESQEVALVNNDFCISTFDCNERSLVVGAISVSLLRLI
ncbi:putative Zinc finger, RING-CH-type, Zinc finger, RING/FYVE/PHD-type [Helianthus annuus]|nr:putative Zinc finger, RING-CH-type, Zinc finger, RING/FYVE/PHD-type [Helianthus annuus]KAJ0723932.1 putative Zinc finger, RING-CH-type, Zinc finger, RING/FYVE/PHD-type [Helianthus annuus]KAJ0954823.1 putative Zinc finger, RING-CH-type, Zinc finger, RING/FYVE/PHD-type [Helianthus annuus]